MDKKEVWVMKIHKGLDKDLNPIIYTDDGEVLSLRNVKGMTKKQIDETIANFIKKQEPLGEEFEKVLHDNLWELYEKD